MPRGTDRAKARRVIAMRSPIVVAVFGLIFDLTLRRGFNAVRIAKAGPALGACPRLVIYTNHPSWWDAVTYAFIARHLFAGRAVFSPIEAAMIDRYPFMAKIGGFGVKQRSMQGARDFLAVSGEVLSQSENILIVACQGRFADPRERPLRIERGIAHLTDGMTGVSFVPLAIEYVFWEERRPELLLRFGAPIAGDDISKLPVGERRTHLEAGLETTMSALAGEAVARDATAFDTTLAGKTGVNPIYDCWRRAKAAILGQSFDPRHGNRT